MPVVFDLAPDDRRVAYARSEIFREFDVYDDLYETELGSSAEPRRLTYGLRATEPAYAPDGSRLAFVARLGSGATWLGVLDLRTGQTARLLEASADEKIFTPDFTPDGAAIVFSQQHGNGRAI